MGWGTTSDGFEADLLQNVKLTIYNESSCENLLLQNSSSQICAGNLPIIK